MQTHIAQSVASNVTRWPQNRYMMAFYGNVVSWRLLKECGKYQTQQDFLEDLEMIRRADYVKGAANGQIDGS